jgi:hypothetical protein
MSDNAGLPAELVECVDNEGYEVDLRVGRVYHMLPDPVGERGGSCGSSTRRAMTSCSRSVALSLSTPGMLKLVRCVAP